MFGKVEHDIIVGFIEMIKCNVDQGIAIFFNGNGAGDRIIKDFEMSVSWRSFLRTVCG
jgi:hypothetical protein